MKYTIEGFSQQQAVKFRDDKQKLDCIDLVLLRWFVDFKDTPKMKYLDVQENRYYWVNYEKILSDIPILSMSKRAVYDRLQKLVKFGILTHHHVKDGGSFSYYGIGPAYELLISDDAHSEAYPYEANFQGGMKQTSEGVGSCLPTIDSSISDSSIIRYNITPSNPPMGETEKPKKKRKSASAEEVEAAVKAFGFPDSTNERLREWLEIRNAKRVPNTVSAVQKCLKTLPDTAKKSQMSINAYLDQVIMRGWAAFYEIQPRQQNNGSYGRRPEPPAPQLKEAK